MISQRVFLAAALLAVCGLVTSANAASLQVDVQVSSVFLGDFTTPAEWTPNGNGADIEPGQGIVSAQVDFLVSIADVGPGELGIGNVNFDVPVSGGASDAFGWIADQSDVDHDGIPITPRQKTWPDNGDLGTPGDLIDIVVGVSPGDFGPDGVDPRRGLGQDAPVFMGSIFASINSDDIGNSGLVEAVMKAFSTYDENAQLARNVGPSVGGGAALNVVPEPTTCVLLGLGGVLMLGIRRKRS